LCYLFSSFFTENLQTLLSLPAVAGASVAAYCGIPVLFFSRTFFLFLA
jgi:hypothetical protein